jgi:hypothetical protein
MRLLKCNKCADTVSLTVLAILGGRITGVFSGGGW